MKNVFLLSMFLMACVKNSDTESHLIEERSSNNKQEPISNVQQTYFKEKIGVLINGSVDLIPVQDIEHNWENGLNNVTNKAYDIQNVEVISDGVRYVLLAKSNLGNLAIELIKEEQYFYEAKVFGGSMTVTCSGCQTTSIESVGMCEPKLVTAGWYCTFCSVGECEKTAIASSSSFLTINE